MLRLAGAGNAHAHQLAAGPVPLLFGIDTPSPEQLIGSKHTVEKSTKIIGDTLEYLTRGFAQIRRGGGLQLLHRLL